MATIRKNQKDLTNNEQDAFKDGITQLIANGTFSSIVQIHADMNHQMHGTGTNYYLGYHRFLPWHRVFLSELEKELQKVDSSLFIPYWKWTEDRDIPDWLKDFMPSGIVDEDGDPLNITRTPGANQNSPIPESGLIQDIMSEDTYHRFVIRLEHAHNFVHSWIGGRMNDIFYSPSDPLFWLHHTEMDRRWNEWQKDNPNEDPVLVDDETIMDPWQTTAQDVKNIDSLDYKYE